MSSKSKKELAELTGKMIQLNELFIDLNSHVNENIANLTELLGQLSEQMVQIVDRQNNLGKRVCDIEDELGEKEISAERYRLN